jgi:hypothetical protein
MTPKQTGVHAFPHFFVDVADAILSGFHSPRVSRSTLCYRCARQFRSSRFPRNKDSISMSDA